MTSSDRLREQARALRAQLPGRRRATPPAETGRWIATIERSGDEEIHVCWCEYQGKPYVSVRMWNRGRDGQWYPDVKRGLSIRLRELPDVAEAIAEAMGLAEAHQRQRQPGQAAQGGAVRPSAGRSEGAAGRRDGGAPGGPREQRGWDPTALPAAECGGVGPDKFDEFS